MRNETSLANEVRVKLHIKSNQDAQIRNLWMCLNYDQKPSVSHIAEHIRKNFCSANERKTLSESVEPEVKLFLDDFWLPPYENSRLIRENDCVKVELKYDEEEKSCAQEQTTSKCISKSRQHVRANETVKSNDKHVEAYYPAKADHFTNSNDYYRDERADQFEKEYEDDEYYYHYYEDEEVGYNKPDQARYNQQRAEPCDPFEYWSSNIQTDQREKAQAKNATYTKTSEKQQQQQARGNQQTGKESQKTSSTKQDAKQQPSAANCYKKFAVASYAHLLNEPVAEQQATSKPAGQQKKSESQQQQQQARRSTDSSVDLDRIASNVNSTGKQKWKNSTKPAQSNGPKHIIFPSTDSESTSSSSSSDSSEDEATIQKKPVQQQQQQQQKQQANKKETTAKTSSAQQNKKQFYEPTKEEQLNTVNTNRSFTVQNPKTLSEFKKVFNETKLNAPKAEEFTKKQTQPKQEKSKQDNTKKQSQNQNQLNTSTDSTTSSSSSGSSSPASATTSPSKRNHRKKSPSPVKVDYEKLAKLEGMPRVHDKLAFQILEISSNFTPEISSYKTGTVIDIDNASNEITIRLNNKYNAVLKRPNKFNVVLDETEEENGVEQNETEPAKIKRQNSSENENTLKIDWRNLMNLKLIPEEAKKETDKVEFAKLNDQQPKSVDVAAH